MPISLPTTEWCKRLTLYWNLKTGVKDVRKMESKESTHLGNSSRKVGAVTTS